MVSHLWNALIFQPIGCWVWGHKWRLMPFGWSYCQRGYCDATKHESDDD